MKKTMQLMVGVLLALSSLWGGAYAVEVFPFGHWACFPSVMTAGLMFCAGVMMAVLAPNAA